MLKKVLLTGAAAMAFSALVSASAADAALIADFAGYADYTAVTTVGIATFSLQQGAYGDAAYATGSPVVHYGGLSNSNSGAYPTASILDVSFSQAVGGVSFTFNNEGANYSSGATAYNSANTVVGYVALGNYNCAYGCTKSITGPGITDLKFSNGTGGGGSWIFALNSLSTAVPEPSSWALMLGGLGFIGYVLRRRVLRAA